MVLGVSSSVSLQAKGNDNIDLDEEAMRGEMRLVRCCLRTNALNVRLQCLQIHRAVVTRWLQFSTSSMPM